MTASLNTNYQDGSFNDGACDVVKETLLFFPPAAPKADSGKQRHQLCGFCGEVVMKEITHRIMLVETETFRGYRIYFFPFPQNDIHHKTY